MTDKITFTLDGAEVTAEPGESIWQVATRLGTEIPHLCHSPEPGYRADGNCRACMVEIEGERVLAASCIRAPADGMVGKSASERAKKSRRMVFELLLADQVAREDAHDGGSKFWHWADKVEIDASRFPAREMPAHDLSHPAMAVNLDACINCGLCVRACREVQVNDVIGMAGRGASAKIVFDFDDDMGDSTCVACGECVQACPTGALLPKSAQRDDAPGLLVADKTVDSVRIDNEFTGAGPLLGVDFTHPLFQTSTTHVNVYAGGSVAMLYGDGDLFLDENFGNDLVIVDRENGIVYNGEVRFGLEAIFRRSPKSLIEYFATVGLEGQYWADIGTVASRTTDAGDPNHMLDGDLGLLGGNFMLGVRGEF